MKTDHTAPQGHVTVSMNESHRIMNRVSFHTPHNPCVPTKTPQEKLEDLTQRCRKPWPKTTSTWRCWWRFDLGTVRDVHPSRSLHQTRSFEQKGMKSSACVTFALGFNLPRSRGTTQKQTRRYRLTRRCPLKRRRRHPQGQRSHLPAPASHRIDWRTYRTTQLQLRLPQGGRTCRSEAPTRLSRSPASHEVTKPHML